MATERLQKLMAKAGFGSRRACEEIIRVGRVTVNSHPATLGMQADPNTDDVRVDGSRLKIETTLIYIMLNKPYNVISDEDVAGKWPRARDLIPVEGHLYPVGRLDLNSEGLMLFTNDGELAHRLTHPRYEHPKTYRALVHGEPDTKTLTAWRRGILLDGEPTSRADVSLISKTKAGTLLEVIVREGRKRMIRRVAAALGHPIITLKRIALGPLKLGDLAPGAWRRLSNKEITALQDIRMAPAPRRRAVGDKPVRRPVTPTSRARKPEGQPRRPSSGKTGRR